MSQQKLTDRTELNETPHNDDVIHIVDVSDTTHSPEGTSKKIKYSNLVQGQSSTLGTGNTVTFENPLGKFYNTTMPNGLDIVLDDTNAVNGGTAVVYSIGLTEPSISGGDVISKVGNYNTDGETLNVIFITRDVNGKYLVNTVDNSFTGFSPTYNTETQDLFTQADTDGYTKPTLWKSIKLNNFIQGLKDNGIYSLLDRLYITDTNGSENFSMYDVINPTVSGNKLTKIGTPTFTPLSGWSGASTHALNTNFNPSTDGVNYQQDSASIIVYQKNTTTGYLLGVIESGDTSKRILLGQTATDFFTAINDGSIDTTNTPSDSLVHVNRDNSLEHKIYKNGTLFATKTKTSTGLPNDDVYLLARNFSGVNTASNGTVSICLIGGDLSGKASIINTLVQNYLS